MSWSVVDIFNSKAPNLRVTDRGVTFVIGLDIFKYNVCIVQISQPFRGDLAFLFSETVLMATTQF
jgi:hypothetical protein